jgi:hypothetical protein
MIGHDMKLRQFAILGLLIILSPVIHTGCRSGPDKRAESVPEWLYSTPSDDRYFYAVGISGQTRKTNEAWDQAIQRARAELGRTIFTHVTSKGLTISTTRGEYSSQIIDILSDTELNFTEVIERWYDRIGIYGPINHYYVLVRLEKKRAKMILQKIK